MSADDFKRNRATSGGKAAAASPLRFAPLRAVEATFSEGFSQFERLECGHTMRPRGDMIGTTYTARRRCLDCLRESCHEAGHPFDIERGTEPSCKCGAADGAASHLRHYHGITEGLADLAAAVALHESADVRREHFHWTTGQAWEVRTRPERRS